MDFNGGQLSSLVGCCININELDTRIYARRRLLRVPQGCLAAPETCFVAPHRSPITGDVRRSASFRWSLHPFLCFPSLQGTLFPMGKRRFKPVHILLWGRRIPHG